MTLDVSDLMRMLRQRSPATTEQEDIAAGGPLDEAITATTSTPGAESLTSVSPVEQATAACASNTLTTPGYRLAAIPVDLIQIDPRQPRRTLPDDLRDACAHGRLGAREAILKLCRRAQDGDGLAAARVAQLQELAGSIREVGLEYPPRVTKVQTTDGAARYRLVDGERRFWAWLLLLASADPAERAHRESIPVMVEDDDASPEQLLKAQWVTNLQREAVPVVDIADYVLSVRDTYASRLQVDPQPWIAALGEAGRTMSIPEAVAELTAREVAATMGRRLGRSNLFRHLAIAEKLRADVKAIARVRQFGLRQCEWLSRLSPAQQIEAARRMGAHDDASGEARASDTDRPHATGAGRPKLLDGRITLLVRVAGDLGRDKEASLRRADPVKLQELRQATTDAIGALQGYVRLIDRSLADAGGTPPAGPSNPVNG